MKRTIVIRDAEPAGPAGPPGWLKLRPALTLLCAMLADGLQWVLPFLWPVCDGAMVIAVLILWGWRWEILVAVIPELIPGLALSPTWMIFAGYLILSRRDDVSTPAVSAKPQPKAEKRVEPL